MKIRRPRKKKTPELQRDLEEEILAAKASLKAAGYFPDCISFNLDGYRIFCKIIYDNWHEFVHPDKDRYSGLLIRVNYGKQEELFIVYQSWTKLDPFWPKEYLAKLAFRSLNKDI